MKILQVGFAMRSDISALEIYRTNRATFHATSADCALFIVTDVTGLAITNRIEGNQVELAGGHASAAAAAAPGIDLWNVPKI